jgi:hypothetical protein
VLLDLVRNFVAAYGEGKRMVKLVAKYHPCRYPHRDRPERAVATKADVRKIVLQKRSQAAAKR